MSSAVAGVPTTDAALVSAWAASAVPPVLAAVPGALLTAPPADPWAPVSLPADEAGVPRSATWDDRPEVAVPLDPGPDPEPEPEAVGAVAALLEVAGAVAGLAPELPETATGSLVEMAVASPVSPLLEAEELALEGPELPEVAVGFVTTFEPPPVPPPELPAATLPPPVLVAAMAGDANNTTMTIVASAATHQRIGRLVLSAINPVLRG